MGLLDDFVELNSQAMYPRESPFGAELEDLIVEVTKKGLLNCLPGHLIKKHLIINIIQYFYQLILVLSFPIPPHPASNSPRAKAAHPL